jgi:pantothenate synthetase
MASSAIRLPATAWDKSGLLSPEEIVAALGIKPTPEQMTIISLAASERNLAVSQANQALAAALQKTLGSSDAELAAKLAEEKERRRMEIMRIRQPSRYQALKNKKK